MPHSFPSIDDRTNCKTNDSADGSDVFRPLYQDDVPAKDLPAQFGLSKASGQENRDAEEEVFQNGHKKGLEAGRQNACALIEQEIVPEIETFAVAFQQLNEDLRRIEDQTCQKILELSIAAAAKILSAAPNIGPQALSGLKTELKQFLANSYKLKLMLNDQDMNALSECFCHKFPNWKDCDRIILDGQGQIPAGEMQTEPGGQPIGDDDSLGRLTRSLEKLFDLPSTK